MPDYQQIAVSREVLDAQLKALIGNNTALEYKGYFAKIYVIDSTILKALDVLKDEGAIGTSGVDGVDK
jgi:carboxyl-terminal processing protease